MSSRDTLVEAVGLREINPAELEKNPDNPRMIFDTEELTILRESIEESGILVPLLVYIRKKDGKYIILDGERRWRCALALELDKVPANVISEPTQIENILTMFNIHNVRSQWEPMPTALKIEFLIRILKIKNPRKSENIKKLAKLTGMSQRGVEHSLRLLSFPKRYQDMILTRDDDERITADFFIESYPVLNLIEKNLPEISNEYSRDDITDRFIDKYQSGVISSARDFRKIRDMIRVIKKGEPRENTVQEIKNLLTEPRVTIEEAYDRSTKIYYDIQNLEYHASQFLSYLSDIEPTYFKENMKILRLLDKVRHVIENVLKKVDSSSR